MSWSRCGLPPFGRRAWSRPDRGALCLSRLEVVEVLNARSYSELLQPIPNAVALLMAADSVNGAPGKTESEQKPDMQLAQYYPHHHHHHHYRRYHHHHHHHHHHRYHHHHHHHHYY